MNHSDHTASKDRRPLGAWKIVLIGVLVEGVPVLVELAALAALVVANPPRARALAIGIPVCVLGVAWCGLASTWWRRWAGTRPGVDRKAVERLARRFGLIWRKL